MKGSKNLCMILLQNIIKKLNIFNKIPLEIEKEILKFIDFNKFCKCYQCMIHVNAGQSPCKMHEIKWKIKHCKIKTMKNNKEFWKNTILNLNCENPNIENIIKYPNFIESGDIAYVIFEPMKCKKGNLIVSKYSFCKKLGQLIGLSQQNIVMIGKIVNAFF